MGAFQNSVAFLRLGCCLVKQFLRISAKIFCAIAAMKRGRPKFCPGITRVNANRKAKESLLYFAKLWECNKSSCRFGQKQGHAKKRCEDARTPTPKAFARHFPHAASCQC